MPLEKTIGDGEEEAEAREKLLPFTIF